MIELFVLLFGWILGMIGFLFMFGVIIVPPMIWRAFVMSKMWLWFIVPIFHVIPIGWVACIGVSAFIGMFAKGLDVEKYERDLEADKKLPFGQLLKKMFKGMFMWFGTPLVTLLIGWLTKDSVLALVK